MAIPAGLLVHHFVLDGNISVIIGVAMELCTDIYAPYRTNSYNFVCVCQDTTVWLLRDVCHLPGQDTITPAISSNVPEWATLTLPCTKWTKFHFVWPRSSIDQLLLFSVCFIYTIPHLQHVDVWKLSTKSGNIISFASQMGTSLTVPVLLLSVWCIQWLQLLFFLLFFFIFRYHYEVKFDCTIQQL